MTCRASRSRMALAAGGDLTGRAKRRWEKHLVRCAACRAEFTLYQRSIELARDLARQDKAADWSEAEWRRTINRAVAQGAPPRRRTAVRLPGWAWAGASALLAVLILGGTFFLKRERGPRAIAELPPGIDVVLPETPPAAVSVPGISPSASHPRPRAVRRSGPSVPAPRSQVQSVMAMTFVSQETGLKIYWVFNDSFAYEEDKK